MHKAGVTSKRLNEQHNSSMQTLVLQRSYSPQDEFNRDLDNRQRALVLTLGPNYSVVKNDNLWNEKDRLPHGQHKYTIADHTFRRSPQNLELIQAYHKHEKHLAATNRAIDHRNTSLKRQQLRTLENKILMRKSNQPLEPQSKQELQIMQSVDPQWFDTLKSKKQWQSMHKDPQKTLEDLDLNDLPQRKVDLIVTDKVLQLDKLGCDSILNKMLEEAKQDDTKINLKQEERAKLIAKLHERHRLVSDLEQKSGVKLGQRSNSVALSNDRGMLFKFDPRSTQPQVSQREHILALPKPLLRGHDFFLKPDFRGLLVSDFQDAIGKKAYKIIDELNRTTVSKFPGINSFRDDYTKRKTIKDFYDQNQSKERSSFKLTDTFQSTIGGGSELQSLSTQSQHKWAQQAQSSRRSSLQPLTEREITYRTVNTFREPKRDKYRGSRSLLMK